MANTSSAEKRIRQEQKRTVHNRAQRSRMKTAIKRVSSSEDPKEAAEALKDVSALLDRLASRRIIHRNKAMRKKAQLAKVVNELTAK